MSQGIGFAARLKIVLPIASHSVSPEHCGWWRFIPTDTRWWEIYSMNGLSLSSAGLRWLDLTSHLFPPSSQTHHQQLRGVVFRNSERAPLVNNLTEHRYTYQQSYAPCLCHLVTFPLIYGQVQECFEFLVLWQLVIAEFNWESAA